mmetsp:Transcript_33322/g.70106  ORF Transcript_33322/g.70106 Transcript_33322/m.70106 type:complete len:328 (-) Transcript_33322:331-1314(-)
MASRTSSLDPLERLMAKFDITGQEGVVPKKVEAPELPLPISHNFEQTRSKPHATEIRRTSSMTRRPSRPQTHRQQLKHALTLNAAHVITHDYLMLSQPLAEGLLLMDRTERKLKLIHSLGELQPLHKYTTEYGNTLARHKKHKALLAGSIEIDVTTDEADFDKQLEKSAMEGSTGHLQLAQRQATYRAFTSYTGSASEAGDMSDTASAYGAMSEYNPRGSMESVEISNERLQENTALRRIEQLTTRLAEMESWFASVKSEAASDRKMREQASFRLETLQQRVERQQEELSKQIAENKMLRARLDELRHAEPDPVGHARPAPMRAFGR